MLTEKQKDLVFRFIQSYKGPSFTFRDVVRVLDIDSDNRRNLQRYLDELDDEGVIHRIKRGRYALLSAEPMVAGTLTCHRDGYGFLVPDDRSIFKQDIFIPPRNMEGAIHGDRVLIKVATKKRRVAGKKQGKKSGKPELVERVEGIVVRILERRHPTIVGKFFHHVRFPYVIPLDQRMLHDIRIPFHASNEAKDGQIVVVSITVPPERHQQAEGRIEQILGYPGDPGIEYKIVEHKFGLPVEFSREALADAAAFSQELSQDDYEGREDLRDRVAVTIDGETARDFDDAVSLEKLPSGHYLLGVHIADVSHYVYENSAIDRDAYDRGTSVYFPDRAIPMLPPQLSSGICSLKPKVDRLVLSVFMEVNAHGKVVKHRFVQGVLCSWERMTYTSVAKILLDRDPDEIRRYSQIVPLFEMMEELCLILSKKRYRRGSVDFDLPEAAIDFDKEGRIISVLPAERNIAHRMIEEFMILANETVAQELEGSGGPALYRVHEQPDKAKVDDFSEFALGLGYRLENERGEYRSRDFQKFIAQLEGKTEGRFLTYLMLRSFMQARYSELNVGHFGLASDAYTHFTSPIRRYPDLIVHRLLKERLKKFPSQQWQSDITAQLQDIASHSSTRERIANEAEREIERIKIVQFMSDKVGEEFDAIIFSVIRNGFYVELLDHFVEGFVPFETLIDDRYEYKEKTHTLVGKQRRRQIRLGARIRVRLDRADRDASRLFFSAV